MPSFYNGKRFFLTYPRCEHTKEELLAFLSEKAEVSHYTICRELHEDGTPHLHACVEFLDVQRHPVAWLDFDGKHPNKQDPRKWVACVKYCKKGGDFIEDVEAAPAHTAGPMLECASFEKKEDWFDHCCAEKYSFQYACWFWDRIHSSVPTVYEDDLHVGKMCKALETFKFVPDLHKTLILMGKAGCGKTTWAKVNAPKPALFVSHVDDLKLYSADIHKSIIFDDVDFNHFPRTSQIHLCDFDNPRSIHCRHAVARIPAGVYKIFTANVVPVNVGDPSIKRRVKIFNVIN